MMNRRDLRPQREHSSVWACCSRFGEEETALSAVVITGSSGLVGSEAARYFARKGLDVVGIDNHMRGLFFGNGASSEWQRRALERELGSAYRHVDADVRDASTVEALFREYATAISLVIHAAAQPSHEWAALDPITDFTVNALGTLHLLDATRRYAPDAVFIFMSTSKVYGDRPNRLPLLELPTRWEIAPDHQYASGIREDMSIDQSLHSIFGASKIAADVLVQEYARYFGLRAVCFRSGCLTGPNHSGTELHGFLAHLMKCAVTQQPYTVFGYRGKQVRDNLHSADLVRAFDHVFAAPQAGAVYNIGGGRSCNCSVLEAIQVAEELVGRPLPWTYAEKHRVGDHIWWISDTDKFRSHYPQWQCSYDMPQLCREICEHNQQRWTTADS